MPLKQVKYQDSEGRFKVVLLPEQEPDDYAEDRGIPYGPPNLDDLDLPHEISVRLNNELYYRGIFTATDAIKRRSDIQLALMAALKVDTARIFDIYVGKGE